MTTASLNSRAGILQNWPHLACCLHEAALRFPNQTGLTFEDRRLSYSRIDADAQALALYLGQPELSSVRYSVMPQPVRG
jgi:hypothetical protein